MSDAPNTPKIPAPWALPQPRPRRLETPRLVLRFWEPADAAAMLAVIDAGRASLLPWLPWAATDNHTVAECAATIERFRANRERTDPPPDSIALGMFERATGVALGGTSLHAIDHKLHEAEVGYWVRADRRGQGLCTEAVAGLLTWAFTPANEGGWGLRRVHIRCAGENKASQAVPRKLGLREEARLVKARWVDGIGWDDTLAWGVLAEEWRNAHRDEPRAR